MNTVFYGEHLAVSSFGKSAGVYMFKDTVGVNGPDAVTTVKVDVKDKQGTVVAWGKNNKYPQEILEAVRKNGSASSGLRFRRMAHYGNGLALLRNSSQDGKKKQDYVPVSELPGVDAFFRKSQMARFWKEIIADLEYFGIAFPEYILSQDFSQINRVKRQPASWCRFEIMNDDSGLIENVYISQKFGVSSVNKDSEYVAVVPVIDSYWSAEEVLEYCKRNKIKKFIRPIFYPLLDEAYYPIADWHAVYASGWLDVANSVPEFKKKLFENQISIKYQIEVHEQYFENIYKEHWSTFTPDQRLEIRKGLIDSINDHLSGNQNAGKSIQSMKFTDEKGNHISAITITTIDDKFKDGSYLPEAEAANSEVLFALGVDPTLIGAGIPGGKLGAGSGSDKNAAMNILSALFKTNRETTLEVFDFIKDYNKWDATITAAFENTILTTLDVNPTGTQKVV